jgi:hypothetical protein
MPLLSHERQIEPEQVSPEIIRYLTEQVCNHALVLIVWSHPYSRSFWTMLEMKAALLAKKPIIVIQTDNENLPRDLSGNDLCKVVDITPEYRTSQVASLISSMLSMPSSSENCDDVCQKLQEFAFRNYQDQHQSSSFSQTALIRYSEIVSRLRKADDQGQLHDEIRKLDDDHVLDDGLRKYLELVIGGRIKAQWEDWYYTYLLGEILDVRFLHPTLPPKLRVYYEIKIRDALNPPKQEKVEMLIDDMVEECLFNREFIEYFGYFLGKTRRSYGSTVADLYWDLCTSRASEGV